MADAAAEYFYYYKGTFLDLLILRVSPHDLLMRCAAVTIFVGYGFITAVYAARETRRRETITKLAKFPSENPSPVLRISREGTVLYGNEASRSVLDAWECSEGQIVPNEWRELVIDALETGSSRRTELECDDRVFSLTFAPVVGSNYVNVYALDVTERKRAEEAVRASEENYREIFNAANDGIFIHDMRTGEFLDVNQEGAEMLGYKPEEMRGMTLADISTDPPPYTEANAMLELEEAHEHTQLLEWYARKKDGQRIWVEVNLKLAVIMGRKRILAVVRDITDRKRAEEQMERHSAELATLNKELEAFTYSVSHDLRSPLRSMAGFSQALLEDYKDTLDAHGQDYLNRIRAAREQMEVLIDDLLKLSRISRETMQPRAVNLSEVARKITDDLRRSQPQRQVDFVIQDDLVVDGNENLLVIALQRLLENAWKFTSKHPTAKIEFGATEINGKFAYFVRDDGAGFEMGYAAKLFGAFQRLHSAVEFPGSGIGLATVQRIIARHDGSVWAEGAVEKGATFYFTLGRGKESKNEKAKSHSAG